MSARRKLKLVPATSPVKGKKNGLLFSPTTGTCLISPFSSPRSNHAKKQRNDLSNGRSCLLKAQPYMEALDFPCLYFAHSCFKYCAINVVFVFLHRLLVLQSEVEHSVERFLQTRKKLTNLKALEGTRELENILGTSDKSGNLKMEVKKSRKLSKKDFISFQKLKSNLMKATFTDETIKFGILSVLFNLLTHSYIRLSGF
uniref:Centromere protein R n=1 Tax=Pseudonaja textilis TaxID=8673 RepID=A0A670ZXH1_PSETE